MVAMDIWILLLQIIKKKILVHGISLKSNTPNLYYTTLITGYIRLIISLQ